MLKKLLVLVVAAWSITACQCASNLNGNVVGDKHGEANYRVVFFEFNSAKLSNDAAKMLDRQVEWLKNNPEIKITVEGYCDERGGEKYNMMLGKKRAEMVKKYLTNHGVKSERIKVVSYGKDHPLASGATEEAWAQNRRAVTITKQ